MVLLLNFNYPLSSRQRAALEADLGISVEERLYPCSFDPAMPLAQQVQQVVEQVELTALEWRTTELLVQLPGLSTASALMLVAMQAKMSYFPDVIRMKPMGRGKKAFAFAEIIETQKLFLANQQVNFDRLVMYEP